jgi:hypothetical protein
MGSQRDHFDAPVSGGAVNEAKYTTLSIVLGRPEA